MLRPFLRGMDTLSGETSLSDLFYLPSEKGSALKGKNLLPFSERIGCAAKQTKSHKNCLGVNHSRGSKFFSYSVGQFSEGAWNAVKQNRK